MKRTLFYLLLFATTTAQAQLPALVRDSRPGTGGISPFRLITFGESLYFYASDQPHGLELWVYNDQDTPKMVYDIYPGTTGSGALTDLDRMAVMGNKLYFQAGTIYPGQPKPTGDVMFVYDGVVPPQQAFTLGSNPVGCEPNALITVGNKLFFTADSGGTGSTLYSYDGVNPPHYYPIKPTFNFAPSPKLGAYSGQVYYSIDSGNGAGDELYVLNPATDTWKMAADINPGAAGSHPRYWFNTWGKLFFVATSAANGRELYSYDGVAVKRLTDLAPGAAHGITSPTQNTLTAFKGAIYFCGSSTGSSTQELYKWDSASGNTSLVSPAGLNPMNGGLKLIEFGNDLYFYGSTAANGAELWKYDGISCKIVADLNPGTAAGVMTVECAIYKNRLYFTGNNGSTGFELYRLNPSASGIASVKWNGEVVVFPNPATSSATLRVTLRSAQSLIIELTDMSGRVVYNSGMNIFPAGKNESSLPVQSLTPGQYFYHISDGSEVMLASGAITKH